MLQDVIYFSHWIRDILHRFRVFPKSPVHRADRTGLLQARATAHALVILDTVAFFAIKLSPKVRIKLCESPQGRGEISLRLPPTSVHERRY
jgi:hypothetical protein